MSLYYSESFLLVMMRQFILLVKIRTGCMVCFRFNRNHPKKPICVYSGFQDTCVKTKPGNMIIRRYRPYFARQCSYVGCKVDLHYPRQCLQLYGKRNLHYPRLIDILYSRPSTLSPPMLIGLLYSRPTLSPPMLIGCTVDLHYPRQCL